MDIRHRISFKDGEMLVCRDEDDTYHVSIRSIVNPLSRGNILDRFDDERQALDAAERFHWMYALAKENGYYLKNDCFIKPNKKEIHIGIMRDGTITREQYILQLQEEPI
ncbi:hypothetical protein [Paenibacillus sp. HJGM_3]|uniref:hypothetical protein n=1 Tax=Paenibacillus sp. HJGM_3 TaxID=3379816 RepID=UPI00385EB19E